MHLFWVFLLVYLVLHCNSTANVLEFILLLFFAFYFYVLNKRACLM